jgi:hypothetical protein
MAMSSIDFGQLFASGSLPLPELSALFLRIIVATLLGGLLAFRLWRPILPLGLQPSRQVAEAQTLIAAAGVVMVVVLGDHPARAFGLVGLGAFIRFRAPISDPRDASVTIFMIGIGMACGLGLLAMAAGATFIVGLILVLFDVTEKAVPRRTLVTISAADPDATRSMIVATFPRTRIVEFASNMPELGKDSGKLVLEMDLKGETDAGRLRDLLVERGVPGVRRVSMELEN